MGLWRQMFTGKQKTTGANPLNSFHASSATRFAHNHRQFTVKAGVHKYSFFEWANSKHRVLSSYALPLHREMWVLVERMLEVKEALNEPSCPDFLTARAAELYAHDLDLWRMLALKGESSLTEAQEDKFTAKLKPLFAAAAEKWMSLGEDLKKVRVGQQLESPDFICLMENMPEGSTGEESEALEQAYKACRDAYFAALELSSPDRMLTV